MLKYVIIVALMSIVVQRYYRYYIMMGLDKSNDINEYESGSCEQRYRNLKIRLNNTVDSDLISNGMALLVSANFYPILDKFHLSSPRKYESNIFMLDLNQAIEAEPLRLNIVQRNKTANTNAISKDFNIFAISLYTDARGKLKMFAANYIPEVQIKDEKNDEMKTLKDLYTIEKFMYDGELHELVHLDSYEDGLNIGQLCDVVAIDDSLFYFTKCFSNTFLKSFKLRSQYANGEIWLYNMRLYIIYPVAKSLLFPKAIAYVKSRSLIVTTNLAVDGLTLYKREFDNSLTKLQDLDLKTFVFNIFVDGLGSLWITQHPIAYNSFELLNSNHRNTPTELHRIKLESRHNSLLFNSTKYFSTNGSTLHAVSSSVYHKNNLVLFSLLNDPRICFKIE